MLIKNIDSDILCLSETHLGKNDTLTCDGYTSFLNNRASKHKNAPKPSGGVAILVKDELFSDFRVNVLDKEIDGLLLVEFVNKNSNYTFVLFACYLPPENSVWGRDPTSFFAHILSQVYLNQNADAMYMCGDFNARVGDLSDVIDGVDDVPKRLNVDQVKRGHGEALIDFVKDGKLAILNGRFHATNDNFTFASSRRK